MAAAGYKARGPRLALDLKRFFSMECAVPRFALLSQACRDAIGSPEALLELERKAMSLLRQASRRGIGGLKFEGVREELVLERMKGGA